MSLKSTRWNSLFSIKPTDLVTSVCVRRLCKLFQWLFPSAAHPSVFPQHLLVCPPSKPHLDSLLTPLAVFASLHLLHRCITFLGQSYFKLPVLILHCTSYYNFSSNEQLCSSVSPLCLTSACYSQLVGSLVTCKISAFYIEMLNMLNQFRSRHLSSDTASISNVNKNS